MFRSHLLLISMEHCEKKPATSAPISSHVPCVLSGLETRQISNSQIFIQPPGTMFSFSEGLVYHCFGAITIFPEFLFNHAPHHENVLFVMTLCLQSDMS